MPPVKTNLNSELDELERQVSQFQHPDTGDRFSPQQHVRLAEIQDRIRLLRQMLDTETH